MFLFIIVIDGDGNAMFCWRRKMLRLYVCVLFYNEFQGPDTFGGFVSHKINSAFQEGYVDAFAAHDIFLSMDKLSSCGEYLHSVDDFIGNVNEEIFGGRIGTELGRIHGMVVDAVRISHHD